jgi:hypothetical protein
MDVGCCGTRLVLPLDSDLYTFILRVIVVRAQFRFRNPVIKKSAEID